jgi:hypothetical protein
MEMDRDHYATYPATPPLRAMVEAAQDFGLTTEEATDTLVAALVGPGFESGVAPDLDEVAGALAQEILAKQRLVLRKRLS